MTKKKGILRFLFCLFLCIILGSPSFSIGVEESLGNSPFGGPDSEMVLVPKGEFVMGSMMEDIEWTARYFHSESLEFYRDETPVQNVLLGDYHIDKYEVSVTHYRKYLVETGKPKPKYLDNSRFNPENHPVVGVTWQEASDYCQWAGKRLPTEAEWEKAARGTDARRYPWGNDPDNKKGNVRGRDDGYRYTSPVGVFPEGRSPYGAMDMAGNVWEWTRDWYLPYPGNDQKNEMFGRQFKVLRGGSWNSNLDLARAALRGKALPDQRQNYIGFRCVRQP